eukprot:scaffold30734_cov32-Phaeocystis_antarctica.AAC.1
MVRTPAPRDHPPAFVRYRLPRAPETCTPFTRGCMTSDDRPISPKSMFTFPPICSTRPVACLAPGSRVGC